MYKTYCILLLSAAFDVRFNDAEVQMPRFKLNDGYDIPAIALGTWLGHNSKPKPNEVELAVKWALDAGYRHIDTAAIYKVEDQVGRALKKYPREEVFVTSKLWNTKHAINDVVPALQESLKNLQLKYVNLYLIHWPVALHENLTASDVDYLDSWRGMMNAKKLGLTRSIGVSNFNKEQIQRIIDSGLEVPAVNQVEINLNLQQPDLLEYAKSKNITICGYTPFGSLFYSKGSEDAPPPRLNDPVLTKMAEKYNKTVPQIALRYLHELGVIPLPKSVTRNRIEQNIDIFNFSLTDEEKNLLKGFDRNYRTLPQYKWKDFPYYPFEKN
ncbi:aldo-keto reductase AKR2E4-like [Danaus plexippus]|nr:aldo-keto reductase AKR2E4-like [Danaus plexippus]